MKFRNNWKMKNRSWNNFMFRLRIASLDILSIEIDVYKEFYLFTILNFTIKNR